MLSLQPAHVLEATTSVYLVKLPLVSFTQLPQLLAFPLPQLSPVVGDLSCNVPPAGHVKTVTCHTGRNTDSKLVILHYTVPYLHMVVYTPIHKAECCYHPKFTTLTILPKDHV